MQMASRLAVELNTGRRWIQGLQQARAEEARQGSLLRQQGQELVSSPVMETPTAQAPHPSLPPLQQQQQQQSPSRSTTQIFVSLDDVYLCLVNNALGVPIAYVSLLGMDYRMQQQEAQPISLDLSASVGLRAGTSPFGPSSFRLEFHHLLMSPLLRLLRNQIKTGYFNQRTFKWESAIDTVAVSADTRKDDDDSGTNTADHQPQQRGVVFQLTVLEPLDVNVTHALLSLAQNEALVSDLLANHTSKTAPYIVRNQTGDQVDVSKT